MEKARDVAIRILDEFEELLNENDLTVPSSDREGNEEEARLYGREYYALEDAIVAILAKEFNLPAADDGNDATGHMITFTLCEDDFALSMGRAPRDRAEFEEWARLCEKGLCDGHIDWDIVYECAREAMEDRAKRE